MPISTIKFCLRALICFSMAITAQASEFAESFDVDNVIEQALADKIAEYTSYADAYTDSQLQDMILISEKLEQRKNTYAKNPYYWFIVGLNHSNIASYYSFKKNAPLTQMHIQKKDLAYSTAIKLDLKSKRMSPAIYSTMKHGLPEAEKILAIQTELALGGNGSSDSDYWYLHWSNIDQLKKAGRDEEAQQAYEKMQKELKKSGADPEIYKALTQQIEKQTFNQTQSKPVNEKPKTVEKQEEPPEEESDNNNMIYISLVAIAIFAILIVTLYELKIKKKP